MPPLKHKTTEPFDIMKSEAVDWLIQQPEIRSYIWMKVNGSKAATYDPDSGIWTGVDFEP
jgi:hypothetical protein